MKSAIVNIKYLLIRTSAFLTTLILGLIIFFIFKEGLGVFYSKYPLDGFTLRITKNNPAQNISLDKLRLLQSDTIMYWNENSKFKHPVLYLHPVNLLTYFNTSDSMTLYSYLDSVAEIKPGLLVLLPENIETPFLKTIQTESIGFRDIFMKTTWKPEAYPIPELGILPLLAGTLWVSVLALLFALPLAVATSIFLYTLKSKQIQNNIILLLELISGVPSVILGFLGLVYVVPGVKYLFNLTSGETILAGAFVLSVILIPRIIKGILESIKKSAPPLIYSAQALGASPVFIIQNVIFPILQPGILISGIRALSFAIGESIIVLMLTGNASIFPKSIFDPARTMAASLIFETTYASLTSLHYTALFLIACILFLITLTLNVVSSFYEYKLK